MESRPLKSVSTGSDVSLDQDSQQCEQECGCLRRQKREKPDRAQWHGKPKQIVRAEALSVKETQPAKQSPPPAKQPPPSELETILAPEQPPPPAEQPPLPPSEPETILAPSPKKTPI